MSLHPIADKAEVSVDFPDKAYMGSFGRHSQFDAYAEADSVAIRLVRPGEDRREAVVHLHYGLLAEILAELARSLAARDPLDEQHRTELSEAAKQLAASLEPRNASRAGQYKMLLQILMYRYLAVLMLALVAAHSARADAAQRRANRAAVVRQLPRDRRQSRRRRSTRSAELFRQSRAAE